MHAASRHGTPSLISLPKDDGVSCFLAVHLEGHPSSFWPYTAMLNFSEANRTGWTAWPLTPQGEGARPPEILHLKNCDIAAYIIFLVFS